MISVIVSSHKQTYFNQLEHNIKETIGVPYEIIKVSNPNVMGICEAYNKGAEKTKYDILCFSHEDINIKTLDWGKKVVELLTDQGVGLIGIAGSKYKTYVPSGWLFRHADHTITTSMNLIQTFKYSNQDTTLVYNNPDNNNKVSQVVTIDGVWFCTRKKVVTQMPFDQKTFSGYHSYDIDFSLQVFQRYKVLVTYEILLEHFSEGNFNKIWILEIFKLHWKWKKILPANSSTAIKEILQIEEYKALNHLIEQMNEYDVPIKFLFYYLWSDVFKTIEAISLKGFFKANLKRLLGYYKKGKYTY